MQEPSLTQEDAILTPLPEADEPIEAPTQDALSQEAEPPEEGGQTHREDAPTPQEAEEPPTDYAALAAEDLKEIKRLDPSYAPAAHLSELPFARRYAQLRDLGLSVAEALAAAAPRFERADGRAHLRAVAPRGTRAPSGVLDRAEMRDAKMLFGDLSEAEINALFRRVTQKNNF